MKTKCLFWLILTMAMPLAAQTAPEAPAPSGASVFAPLVSRLQVEQRGNFVGLFWVDSPDVRGPVYIYRSTTPFERSEPRTGLRIAELPHGAQSHVDEIEMGETDIILYYFVVASDEMGQIFDIPIIYGNTRSILIPAAPFGVAPAPPPAPQEPAPVPVAIPPGISSLRTATDGGRVIITFTQSPGTSGAILYRSVTPIRQTADLSGALIIQIGITSPFADYPVPGIPFYYAVILEEDLIRGTVGIIPGHNVTIAPVEVASLDPADGRRMRPMPLPLLSARYATALLNAHARTPPPRELSPLAIKALAEVPARPAAAETALKRPRVFASDLAAHPAGSEAFALSSIVTGPFAARNWDAARDELIRFLSLPRSPDAQARARFYLGQSYYFMYRPRDALFEFLAIQDRFPAEAMAWIQASLAMLKEQP